MKTMIGIVVGKMVVMPVVGISTAYLLQEFFFDVSDDIAGAFYLVLMIVFLTPTANNVLIMIELSDCEPEVLEGVVSLQRSRSRKENLQSLNYLFSKSRRM